MCVWSVRVGVAQRALHSTGKAVLETLTGSSTASHEWLAQLSGRPRPRAAPQQNFDVYSSEAVL